jgi:proline iminopeptidase
VRSAALAVVVSVLAGCPRSPPAAAPAAPQESLVRSGDVELFVRSAGGGPGARTLLALHGGPGYSHDYLEALDSLASPAIRVVTYDQRGGGRSRTPAEAPLRLADHVADVDHVRAAMGAESIILLGHSWGGFLAESYAVAYPERVSALVLVDPMPDRWADLRTVIERSRARHDDLVARGAVPASDPPASGDDCRAGMNADLPADFADPRHPAARSLGATTCSARTGRVTFESLGHFDLSAGLATLRMPVLLVFGEADANAAALPSLRSQLVASRVEQAVLPSCGHYPFLECPDAFSPRVRAFFDGAP